MTNRKMTARRIDVLLEHAPLSIELVVRGALRLIATPVPSTPSPKLAREVLRHYDELHELFKPSRPHHWPDRAKWLRTWDAKERQEAELYQLIVETREELMLVHCHTIVDANEAAPQLARRDNVTSIESARARALRTTAAADGGAKGA